jgi:hypothetical protein
MRRKLMLPALAACALLAVSAPLTIAKASTPTAYAAKANKSITKLAKAIGALKANVKQIRDTDSGQTGSIHGVDQRVDTVVANLTALSDKVTGVVAASTAVITQIVANLTKLGGVVDSSIVAKPTIVVAQVFAGASPVAANAIRGCFVATPHVPYHGNNATVTINCPVVQIQTDPGAGENSPAAGGPLLVMASCRTAKTNVDLANGKPCALAGIANLQIAAAGAAPAGFLTSKPNAALGGAPLYPMDANKLFSKDPSQAAFPLSLSTGGTDTVDNPAKLVNLTAPAITSSVPAAPSLPACVSGATPCVSTVSLTLRAVDSNAQVPAS